MEYETKLTVWYGKYKPERFATVTKPKIVGFFSLDGQRRYIPLAENLKYLKLPDDLTNVNFNLNLGYENVIHKPESAQNEGITRLLEFIHDNKEKLRARREDDKRYLETDFICYRGLLRLIMCSPYERKEDWCILVTKYKGNIYLCQRETELHKNDRLNQTEQSKKLCSYGFKFEQYILTDDPNAEPNTTDPVNESEEFSCVFKSRLEKHDLLYGAEMDGIKSNEKCDITQLDPNTLEFVEVKVRRKETNYRQSQNFLRFNLRKWWCQSFIVGIQRIYMGLRNDDGIVKEIKILDTHHMTKMVDNFWSPAVCVDFLNEFLNIVQGVVEPTNCPYTVYEFDWNPMTKASITYKYHEGKNDLSFLPDWYIKSIAK